MAKKKVGNTKVLEELGRYKALAQMVGGFVHQLRTPIQIIQTTAENLHGEEAELITRSAQRLNTAVTSVLNFVKGVKPTMSPISLNETLENLGDFLNEECRNRSVTVEKVLQSKTSILQDSLHLQEALLNLLMNALQAMPKGGTLTIHTEDVPTQKKVLLEIKDTGTGMDKKTLAKLATPFHTTKKQGMGLGLFFTRKIFDRHHAKMVFSSEKYRGTTVRIVFPAV